MDVVQGQKRKVKVQGIDKKDKESSRGTKSGVRTEKLEEVRTKS